MLPRRRDPPELFLLGLCLLSGATFLVGAAPPSLVERAMPGWVVTAWYVMLVVAGLVGIAGNLWPGQLHTALLVRLSGQLLAAGPAAAYVVAVVAFAGPGALFSAVVVAAWAGVCLWTARQRRQDLRMVGGAR